MIVASTVADFHACRFAEHTFQVAPSTLYQLQRLYPLPGHLHGAVLKRQVEFLAGRVCAQQALEALTGHPPGLIPSQPDGAPRWPPGIVGSITHTSGYAAALIGSETHYHGIGIDCQVILSPDHLPLQKHICVTQELETLHMAHRDCTPERLLTLVFSAKESLFKCLYPRVREFFGFAAARVIALDRVRQSLDIQLEQTLTPHLRLYAQWTGYFTCQDQLLMTVIVYPTKA